MPPSPTQILPRLAGGTGTIAPEHVTICVPFGNPDSMISRHPVPGRARTHPINIEAPPETQLKMAPQLPAIGPGPYGGCSGIPMEPGGRRQKPPPTTKVGGQSKAHWIAATSS